MYNEPIVISNFISEDEVEHIKQKALGNLTSSTFGPDLESDQTIRNCKSVSLYSSDPVVKRITEKCASHAHMTFYNCEDLHVVHYEKGGYYKHHYDTNFASTEGQRIYTFILALNDDYEGGETEFPNLNNKFKLKVGDAIFFQNLDNHGSFTSKALHGGRPVKSGEKWICNLWIRDTFKLPFPGS